MNIFVDGHLEGWNDRTASSGYLKVIVIDKKKKLQDYIQPICKRELTNNDVEILAVLEGLILAKHYLELKKKVTVFSDSQWAIGMTTKNWEVNFEKFTLIISYLRALYISLKKKFLNSFDLFWIEREGNLAS